MPTDFLPLYSEPQIEEALGWLEDCFEDVPADLTRSEIVAAIDRHFEGGSRAFLEATESLDTSECSD